MPEFRTDTGVIAYERMESSAAHAETITLLHNFMSTGRAAWGPLLEQLGQHYHIVLLDLPGHGQSVGYPIGFQHREIARQIGALMRATGADQGHLAGCSSGGMIAQLLVHHSFVQPATLTLISTTHSVEPARTGDGARLTPERFRAGAGWLEATAALHDPYHYVGYFEEVLLASFRRLRGTSAIDLALDELAAWLMPVCLIHGEQDEFFPPAIPDRMAQVLPHAERHIIPRQSHALIFRQPWKVADLMVKFLQSHPIADRSAID